MSYDLTACFLHLSLLFRDHDIAAMRLASVHFLLSLHMLTLLAQKTALYQ
jgi:hypothetical protein